MSRRSFDHLLAALNEMSKKNQISAEDLKDVIIILKHSNAVEEKIFSIANTILNSINEDTVITKGNAIKEEKYLTYFMNEKSRKIRELQTKSEKGEKKL